MKRIQQYSAIGVIVMSVLFVTAPKATLAAFLIPDDIFENSVLQNDTKKSDEIKQNDQQQTQTISGETPESASSEDTDKKSKDKEDKKGNNKKSGDATDTTNNTVTATRDASDTRREPTPPAEVVTDSGALVPPHPTTTDAQNATSTEATTPSQSTTTPVGGTTLPETPAKKPDIKATLPKTVSPKPSIQTAIEETITDLISPGYNQELSPRPIYGPSGFSRDTTLMLLGFSLVSGILGILFLFGMPATLLHGFRAMSGFRGKLLGPDITYEK